MSIGFRVILKSFTMIGVFNAASGVFNLTLVKHGKQKQNKKCLSSTFFTARSAAEKQKNACQVHFLPRGQPQQNKKMLVKYILNASGLNSGKIKYTCQVYFLHAGRSKTKKCLSSIF
jgi:hypothetical protein